MITGAWQIKPGERLFVFITPTVDPGTGQIGFQSRFAEIPEVLWWTLGLGEFRADAPESRLHQVIGGLEAEMFLEALFKTPGVTVLSPPRVTTLLDRQAQVPVGEGLSLDVLTRLADDALSLDLTFIAEIQPY